MCDEGDFMRAVLMPLHWACACSLRQGKLRQNLHVVYASSCSSLSTQCEDPWVVWLELGTHWWVSFHLPRSPGSHPYRDPSPSLGVWIKVTMKLEKLNFPWLTSKIITEWESRKTGKQQIRGTTAYFSSSESQGQNMGFFLAEDGSFVVIIHFGCKLPCLHDSLFATLQNCHCGRDTFQTETKHTSNHCKRWTRSHTKTLL